jgi:hypothetical protein
MLRALLALAVCFVSVGLVAFAEDEKKKADETKTFEGKMVCAKCTLKMDGIKECTNAIKVKEGDKEVVYLIKDKGKKESYHKCAADTESDVKVTGKVVEKDGKKWIEDAKVEVKK